MILTHRPVPGGHLIHWSPWSPSAWEFVPAKQWAAFLAELLLDPACVQVKHNDDMGRATGFTWNPQITY